MGDACMSDAAETVPVEYRVIGIESVHNSGRLIALAIVEVAIAGVTITLQGCQVRRRADGGLAVLSPQFKCARTGKAVSCVVLPPELSAAIAAEVMAAMSAIGEGYSAASFAPP
jgi:hypothetical protein